jgi:hypothetical protein
MLHARLRGLLQPDYKYGVVSLGAERMVLKALGAEIVALGLDRQTDMETRALGILSPVHRQAAAVRSHDRQKRADRLRRYLFRETGSEQHQRAIDSIVDLFYALERAGVINDEQDEP